MVELKVGLENIEFLISHLIKYPNDASESVCLLSLVGEHDFNFDLYRDEFFSLEVEEVEEDSLKDLPNFLSPSTIDLKPLPSHLKYAFFGPNETLPVIHSSFIT